MEQSEIRRIGRILKERRLQLGYTQEYACLLYTSDAADEP